jgi:AraC-like DNA-binding protein
MTMMIMVARPVVVAAIADREWRENVASALGSWTDLTFVATTRELVARGYSTVPDIALWHLGSAADVDDMSVAALRRFRIRSPRTVVLAYCGVSVRVAPLLVAAGSAGIDGVLLRGHHDLCGSIRGRLAEESPDALGRAVVARLALPAALPWQVVAHCVRRATSTVLTVEQLADELGVHRRTLHNWLRSVGLPSAEQVIGWGRLLLAAALLEAPNRSVASVAARVGFSSEPAFRAMLGRYTGLTPTEVRRSGGLPYLAARFRDSH